MINWRKSPEALVATFQAALPGDGSAERRQMFGYPAAFVNGRMATGLHQEDLIVRLPEARRRVLLKQPGARTFEPMPGRPMKEYVIVPPAVVDDAAELRAWMREAIAHTASLPPKAKAKAKSSAKAKDEAPAKATTKAKAPLRAKATAKPQAKTRTGVNSKTKVARRTSRSTGRR
jgi:TfoX/Sxy family transcriptional regulator of competence genes